MRAFSVKLATAIAIACGSVATQAATIVYQTPAPDFNSPAYRSDADGVAYNATATKAQPVASTVNGIEWWGFYDNPAAEGSGADDSFTLNFYAGAASTPGALVGSFALGTGSRVATGNMPFNYYHQYYYSASFADFALSGGPYFVSVVDSNPSASEWAWQQTGSLGGLGVASRNISGAWIVSTGTNTAFRLTYTAPTVVTSPVPEPQTYAMLLVGLAMLAAVRRRSTASR